MDFEIASMDDHSVFGDIFYQLKFSEAMKRNLLSDYQVIVIGVDDEMINKQIIRRELLTTEKGKSLDAESLANNFAIYKSIKDYNLKKIITFHSRIKNANEFAGNFKKYNKFITRIREKYKRTDLSEYLRSNENF